MNYKYTLFLALFAGQTPFLYHPAHQGFTPKNFNSNLQGSTQLPKSKMMCRCSRCPDCAVRGLFEPRIELSIADRHDGALRRATISSRPKPTTVRFRETVNVRYESHDGYEEIQRTTTRYRSSGSLHKEDRPVYDRSTPHLRLDSAGSRYSGREESRHGPSNGSYFPSRPLDGRRYTHAEERFGPSNRSNRPQASDRNYSSKKRDVSPPRMPPQSFFSDPRTRPGSDPRATSSKHESSKFTSSKPSSSKTTSSKPTSSKPASSSSHHHEPRQDYRPREPESHHSKTRNTGREDKTRGKTSLNPISEDPMPDYYAILGISSRASPDEIAKAARKMRIETHPDKLKTPGMSAREEKKIDERAAGVGQAADVLMDSAQKRAYDKSRL